MMQDIELEQALPEYPVTTSDGATIDSSKGAGYVITTFLGAVATAAVGWIIKRRRTGDQLEDTTNTITVENLTSQRARIAELEAQVRGLFGEVLAANRAQIDAERAASAAASKAEQAAALAEDARRDADRATAALRVSQAHNALLRSAMIAAGLTPPEAPEL